MIGGGMIVHFRIMENGCWEWHGNVLRGYGRGTKDGRSVIAHRGVYESLRGPIPEGMTCDHVCRNTLCVNPDHIDLVPLGQNITRAYAAKRDREAFGCGHPRTEENQQPAGKDKKGRPVARCRICWRAYKREHERKRATKRRRTLALLEVDPAVLIKESA